MTEPVIKRVTVACGADEAFEVFVARIGVWWPKGHSASAASGHEALDVTIEPRVGGAVYETMYDGGRNDWGEVLVYEPGALLAMTWHPGNNAECPTRVEVRFEAVAEGTLVELTHSGWDIWGAAADEKRGMYDGGWEFVLGERFAAACSGGGGA